jgi:hypothetical protein
MMFPYLPYATTGMDFVQKVCHLTLWLWAILMTLLSRLLSIGITSRGSLSYSLRQLSSTPSGSKSLSTTMAAGDTTLQSDISKMKTEADGSFKRANASFRNMIAKGSQFEPENGGFRCFHVIVFWLKSFLT